MKKKFGSACITILCVAMMLANTGCQKAENQTSETIVTVWTANSHSKTFMNEKINEWNSTVGKEKKIKIDYKVQEGDLNEKVELALASNQAPDLFCGGDTKKQIENNQITAFDDVSGGQELIGSFNPDDITENIHLFDGKVYTLPRSVVTYGMIYNKDMFKAAGIVDDKGEPAPPKTLSELREYAKRLTDKSKGEFGIILPGKYGGWYTDDIVKIASVSCGFVQYNPASGTYDYSKEAEVMKTFMGIKEDGSYYPGMESLDNDPARARFAAGKIGMKTAGSYDYAVLTSQFPAEIDWGVAPFPVIDGYERYKGYRDCSGYLKINKASAEKKDLNKIFEVCKWFYSDELMVKGFQNGIDLPIKSELIRDITIGDEMANWKAFAQLNEISFTGPYGVKYVLNGEKELGSIWLNDIWTEKIPAGDIEKTLSEYQNKVNSAVEKYQEENPDYDAAKWIIKDWDRKVE